MGSREAAVELLGGMTSALALEADALVDADGEAAYVLTLLLVDVLDARDRLKA